MLQRRQRRPQRPRQFRREKQGNGKRSEPIGQGRVPPPPPGLPPRNRQHRRADRQQAPDHPLEHEPVHLGDQRQSETRTPVQNLHQAGHVDGRGVQCRRDQMTATENRSRQHGQHGRPRVPPARRPGQDQAAARRSQRHRQRQVVHPRNQAGCHRQARVESTARLPQQPFRAHQQIQHQDAREKRRQPACQRQLRHEVGRGRRRQQHQHPVPRGQSRTASQAVRPRPGRQQAHAQRLREPHRRPDAARNQPEQPRDGIISRRIIGEHRPPQTAKQFRQPFRLETARLQALEEKRRPIIVDIQVVRETHPPQEPPHPVQQQQKPRCPGCHGQGTVRAAFLPAGVHAPHGERSPPGSQGQKAMLRPLTRNPAPGPPPAPNASARRSKSL